MIIAVLKETADYEQRVAVTPAVVRKLAEGAIRIKIEKEAGQAAGFSDDDYLQAGAEITATTEQTVQDAAFLFKIQAPSPEELARLPDGISVIADLRRLEADDELIFNHRLSLYALEKIPRISRAQNMDILSSQDNLAGYKAVSEAVNMLNRVVPMMTTAAGSVPPAKVLVIGIGVAGLQAIATAKRLGAAVSASDIRPETREQAESLGARFVTSENLETAVFESDIVITAAGSPPNAPVLIREKQLESLRRGSILIDISGNVEALSYPETYLTANGATVTGDKMMAALLPHTASILFANNIYNYFRLLQPAALPAAAPDFNDEILNRTCIYYQGKKRE